MRIAKLVSIDANRFISSTIPASSESEYNSSTSYSTGAIVKVSYESDGSTPRCPIILYESLADSNVGKYPPNYPTQWQEKGATNRWAMFDSYVNTQSEATEEIEVEIDSSSQNIVGLFQLQAKQVTLTQIVNVELLTDGDCTSDSFTAETGWSYDSVNDQYDCDGTQTENTKLYQSVSIKDTLYYQVKFTVSNYSAGGIAGYVGGNTGTFVSENGEYTQIVFPGNAKEAGIIADVDFVGSIDAVSVKKISKTETVNLEYYDITVRTGWYYYFFYEMSYLEDIVWSFPDYNNSILRVKITWKPGESAKCGMLTIGQHNDMGKTLCEPEPVVGIIDYSKKETDDLGRTYLKQGHYRKRAEVSAWFYNEQVDAIHRLLQKTRGTPILIDANNEGAESTNYSSLLIYGFYRDFNIIIPGPKVSKLNIEFEGLI